MKELLELIAKALVDHPEEVSVCEVFGEKTTILDTERTKMRPSEAIASPFGL